MKLVSAVISLIASLSVAYADSSAFGAYATPVSEDPPEGYEFYDKIPYNRDTVCRITALYDAMCERGHLCESGLTQEADNRTISFPGCPSPVSRNSLGLNAKSSGKVSKADMLNLYRDARAFLSSSHTQKYPSEEGSSYPAWSSPLGAQMRFRVNDKTISWTGKPNCYAGNILLDNFYGEIKENTSESTTSTLGNMLRQRGYELSPESDSDSMEDLNYRSFGFDNLYSKIVYEGIRDLLYYWIADDMEAYGSPGNLMSYMILENIRLAIGEMDSSAFVFGEDAFETANESQTAQTTVVSYLDKFEEDRIKSWIANNVISPGTHLSSYLPTGRTKTSEIKSSTESSSVDNSCSVERSSSLIGGEVGALLYFTVQWHEGPWELYETKTTTGTREDYEREVRINDDGVREQRWITTSYKMDDCTELLYRRTVRPLSPELIETVPYVRGLQANVLDRKTINDVIPDRRVYVAHKNIPADRFRGDGVLHLVSDVETREILSYPDNQVVSISTNTESSVRFITKPGVTLELGSEMRENVDLSESEISEIWDGKLEIEIELHGFDISDITNGSYYEQKYEYSSGSIEVTGVNTGKWEKIISTSAPQDEDIDNFANISGEDSEDPIEIISKNEISAWKISAKVRTLDGIRNASIIRRALNPTVFGVNRFKFIGQ